MARFDSGGSTDILPGIGGDTQRTQSEDTEQTVIDEEEASKRRGRERVHGTTSNSQVRRSTYSHHMCTQRSNQQVVNQSNWMISQEITMGV
jgi:hypothetical protein